MCPASPLHQCHNELLHRYGSVCSQGQHLPCPTKGAEPRIVFLEWLTLGLAVVNTTRRKWCAQQNVGKEDPQKSASFENAEISVAKDPNDCCSRELSSKQVVARKLYFKLVGLPQLLAMTIWSRRKDPAKTAFAQFEFALLLARWEQCCGEVQLP